VEFGLQCDYLLGQHRGGVEQLGNDTRLIEKASLGFKDLEHVGIEKAEQVF
jgi:hypothetical protein